MLEVGTLLGNRYEIIKKIGAGGMSVVYKAKCQKLNRFVAIKVLREEFANDDTFVTKFRVEAQAAASLSHPNIINVFDVGSDNGTHYIVMELIEGETLQQYIRMNGPLSSKETLEIGIKIARALKVAHANKIVHRDIKPQNIIISHKGDVKVTDFGIARAASTSTITSSANAIGSVHYFSPEQARGGYVDEKSDLYSLGITMYEMVTNTVPFQAESPVTVAIQHIKEEFPRPSSVNNQVTESLEAIIMKATLKKPERRYETANEIIDDMKKALEDPNNTFVEMVDAMDSPTINITGDDLRKIKEETADFEITSIDHDELETEEDSRKNDKVVVISAVVTSLIIIGFLVYAAMNIIGAVDPNEPAVVISNVQVPDLKGDSFEKAKQQLSDIGLGIKKVSEQYADTYDEGVIVEQVQSASTMLKQGDVVEVVVSLGEEKIDVPSVINEDYEAAKATLIEKDLKVEIITTYDDNVQAGYVINQSPSASTKVIRGETITLMVSNGKEDSKIIVPKVKDLTESEAIAKLSNVGLVLGKINPYYHDTVEEGYVIAQTVEAGSEVKAGYVVDLAVSLGPDPNKGDDVNIETPELELEPGDGDNENNNNETDNEDSTDDLKSQTIVIPNLLGDDLESGQLTVVLKFEDEVDLVPIFNEQVTQESFPIEVPAKGKGKATVLIYLEGKLVRQDPVSFE